MIGFLWSDMCSKSVWYCLRCTQSGVLLQKQLFRWK